MYIKFNTLKLLIKIYCLVVGAASVIIAIVSIKHYGILSILFGGLFAFLVGFIPCMQFKSILKTIKE